jgi:hypothetical protein
MNKEKLLKELRLRIRAKYEKNAYAAAELGISESQLSNILAGRSSSVPKSLLDMFGYEKAEEQFKKKVSK